MAKPINNTPTLKGKDAVTFYEHLQKNKSIKIDASVIATIKKDANQLKSLLRN
jgi:hypothetical protein